MKRAHAGDLSDIDDWEQAGTGMGGVLLRADRPTEGAAKRWRIEHISGRWTMQPVGTISASEARALCRRIVTALHHCDEDGVPRGDWRQPFWVGWAAGLVTAGVGAVALLAVLTSWPAVKP